VPPPKRLSEEISELDKQLHRLVAEAASEPLAMNGVSIDTAASLLIAAGDHPQWLRNGGAYLLGAGTFPPERLPAGVAEGKDLSADGRPGHG
jgi:transposase